MRNWFEQVAEPAIAARRRSSVVNRTIHNIRAQAVRHSGRNFFSAFDSEITVFGDILRNTAKERQRTARNSSAELLNTLTRQSELENLISRSYQNITRADAILESAVNMQTGVRGYLLSGREDFSSPIQKATKSSMR